MLAENIQVPRLEEERKKIRRGFFMRWIFSYCIGAVYGKHMNVKCPPGTRSVLLDYKNTFSIVLLACVDHDHCFT